MIRYPLGGMNQWILAWLVGLKALGHDVYLVEHSGWKNACYDVSRGIMTGDCSYGIGVVSKLLARYGLERNWCYVDEDHAHHGLTSTRLRELFASADVFIDLEWGEWVEPSQQIPVRIFYDGDPGWFQFSLMSRIERGEALVTYDYYFTDGGRVGKEDCLVPTAGIPWRHMIPPVLLEDRGPAPTKPARSWTTVMNWKSNKKVEYKGTHYGQKDMEFMKIIQLPGLVDVPLEVAVSGPGVPRDLLLSHGWRIRNADEVAVDVDHYRQYIADSRGEFSAVKNAFARTRAGWFGDRSGYYLFEGRPVIVQDTGFSEYLPCGEGLLSFTCLEQAAQAIASVEADYERHARAARGIAHEYLDARKVLAQMLKTSGVT
jgi:hypothetical protein